MEAQKLDITQEVWNDHLKKHSNGFLIAESSCDKISIKVVESWESAKVPLSTDNANRLYEWLGQALGKHPAGVKG